MQVKIGENLKKLRSTTRANLCFLYLKAKEEKKALKLAKTLPHVWECREILLPELLSGDDYAVELKNGIISILSVICERIHNSKNPKTSSIDKIIALGPKEHLNEDLKEKIELIAQFLGVSYL